MDCAELSGWIRRPFHFVFFSQYASFVGLYMKPCRSHKGFQQHLELSQFSVQLKVLQHNQDYTACGRCDDVNGLVYHHNICLLNYQAQLESVSLLFSSDYEIRIPSNIRCSYLCFTATKVGEKYCCCRNIDKHLMFSPSLASPSSCPQLPTRRRAAAATPPIWLLPLTASCRNNVLACIS